MDAKTDSVPDDLADANASAHASTPPPVDDPGRSEHPAAAVWTCLVAFLGLFASGFFTYVKYRSDYGCDDSYLSACSGALGSDCAATFNSSWAAIGGLPVTIYGAAFYAVALVLSMSLLIRRGPLHDAAKPLLLFAGIADVGTSIVFATYAKVALHTVCFYCTTLYLVSLLFLACAIWVNGRSSLATIRGAVGFRWLRRAAAPRSIVLVSLFVIATVPQAWAYRLAQAAVGVADCPADATSLPATDLREGAKKPTWIFAEFVDPSCPHCRIQYNHFAKLLKDSRYRDRLVVQTFLYPRQPNSPCTPPGFEVRASEAVQNDACLASLAVLCAEKLKPTSGAAMMDHVFALQGSDKPSPWFSRETLKREAAVLGIDEERMSKCMNDDEAIARAVRSQVAFGAAQGIESTPRLYAIPVINGSPQKDRALRFEGGKSSRIYERILDLRPELTRTSDGS